ncbi:HEPN domain protein [Desulfitobacterium hafniense DCB-2]|uniref:HEPN domain protein n=1 Tax=Desulfitobacterium hafniense (strain DSM 10664 / DCB-2) TaxID=272564 RepID=B8FTS9_DESHD|nr:HEPN domain-containing protein [Desulfitobacterium hafniense]ACL22171.1 HEPN domain protein [Desulfitobacterium hafniense DCB-2]
MKRPNDPDVGSFFELAYHRIDVAGEDLDSARLLFEANRYRGANNRAYYSIFHSICAVLSIEGKAFKRHKDTLAYFNKEFIHSEIFPRELGRKIIKAEEIRHASDYDAFYIASKVIAAQQIDTADHLLFLVRKYIEERKGGPGYD